MRSAAFTILLALAAALVCGLAVWSLTRGNLHAITGAPLTPPGGLLYQDFLPQDVARMELVRQDVAVTARRSAAGWELDAPWRDRMDPRAAAAIISFTLGLRVEDSGDIDEIDGRQSGLGEDAVAVRLYGRDGEKLASYHLGRRTPWLALFKDDEPPVSTVYVRTRDRDRRDHVYICTGDITPLFKDGMRFLRDHRPFHFNPVTLQKIRIRSEGGELSLGREDPASPWRIIKPLDLPTDPDAVKSLLEKLYELQAVAVADKASVTLPANGTSDKTTRIGITGFGSEPETLLEIMSPESAESRDAPAMVSDRPDTVFALPLKPEPDLVSLADLPLSVNELRDATLTNLNIASLTGISIRPVTGQEILVSRHSGRPWTVRLDGREHAANEQRLFDLLKAVTAGRATGFETDAATDFSPWGLDRPILVLRFLGGDGQVLEIRFGLDGKGGIFAHRAGTPTVMRVDAALLAAISVRPYEWRHARLWSISKVDLMAIQRTPAGGKPLLLRYNDIDQSWQASHDGADATADLVQTRANFLLDHLVGLETARWLAADDAAAATALATPALSFEVTEKEIDDAGDFKGIRRRVLEFAPVTAGPDPAMHYGRASGEPNFFLIDHDSYQKLSLDLMEDN